jgi:hypothetical protein
MRIDANNLRIFLQTSQNVNVSSFLLVGSGRNSVVVRNSLEQQSSRVIIVIADATDFLTFTSALAFVQKVPGEYIRFYDSDGPSEFLTHVGIFILRLYGWIRELPSARICK